MSALPDLFQSDILARLNGDSYFDTIVIIQEAEGTADTAVRKALAGELPKATKFGAFIIIELPEMDPEDNVRGKYTVRTRLHVRVVPKFNNGTNGTGKTLGEITSRVVQNLHLFLRNSQTWLVEKVLPYSDDAGTIGFEVIVSWAGTGEENLSFCGSVNISTSGTTVTMTTGTSGASIYYTTDGTFPRSGNGTLYTAPFTAASGDVLCAAAYKSGLLGSGISRKTV